MNTSLRKMSARLRRTAYGLRYIGHHHGYGVHSPFAFEYINRVIYERAPYYVYADVERARIPHSRGELPRRVCRLLLRIVNRAQPHTLIDIGPQPHAAMAYLKAGKRDMRCLHFDAELAYIPDPASDETTLVYLHDYLHPEQLERAASHYLPLLNRRSVMLIAGVGYSAEMKRVWHSLIARPAVGVSFRLYDIGILFFDPTKMKRDYIVNF